MVSFSVTDASSEKAKKRILGYIYDFVNKADVNSEYTFCKFALDNSGKVFVIVCDEHYDDMHEKKECTRCQISAFSVDEQNREIPLARMTGELAGKDGISFVDRLDSYYENKGIGRELMLFWESLVKENTKRKQIDIIAINGEKNIPWYQTFDYSVTEYFGERLVVDPDTKEKKIVVDGAFMTKDLTVIDYFASKAAMKSREILESAPEEVKKFVIESNKKVQEYISSTKSKHIKK